MNDKKKKKKREECEYTWRQVGLQSQTRKLTNVLARSPTTFRGEIEEGSLSKSLESSA